MRILWCSNAPWAPTGYGQQTLQVVRRMAASGHRVAIAANWGVQARVMRDEELLPGVPLLPALYDGIGNDIIPAHYEAWADGEPCQIVTLYDVWVYSRATFKELPVTSWVPIDHYPVPPAVAAWCRDHEPIAMSLYGQQRLADVGIEARYIPHAIEPSVFHPMPRARADLRWKQDAFVVLIAAANKGSHPMRKAWNEMFGAVSMLMKAHDDVRLFLHTERIGGNGPDLAEMLDYWRIDAGRVDWTPQYAIKTGQVEPSDVARLYSASDVLLATSMGEGFGIPVVEAQACGLPVIVSDWTAQPELVGGGWVAAVQPWYHLEQHAGLVIPIITSVAARLEEAYAARGDQKLREAALAKAAEYEADKVWREGWLPWLADLEARNASPPRRERRHGRPRVEAVA